MNTITFHHQDGDMTFDVKWAWFMVSSSNQISLSIECEEHPDYDWMSSPSFCLVDFPLKKSLAEGTTIRFPGNKDEITEGPHAHVYVGAHQSPREVEIQVKRVTTTSCDIDIAWVQDDADYYDERAKKNRVDGRCKLKRGERKNLWIPQ